MAGIVVKSPSRKGLRSKAHLERVSGSGVEEAGERHRMKWRQDNQDGSQEHGGLQVLHSCQEDPPHVLQDGRTESNSLYVDIHEHVTQFRG